MQTTILGKLIKLNVVEVSVKLRGSDKYDKIMRLLIPKEGLSSKLVGAAAGYLGEQIMKKIAEEKTVGEGGICGDKKTKA